MTDSTDDLSRLVSEMRECQRQLEHTEPKARESNRLMWHALAGEQMDTMIASRENAHGYLRDPSWKLRLAAISILRTIWKADERLSAVCEDMAFSDPHSQVRGVAIFTLACCFMGTNDRRIGSLLRRIVHDESLDESFREAAYSGLFELRGTSAKETPMPGKYRFPEDIKWPFVDSFPSEETKEHKV